MDTSGSFDQFMERLESGDSRAWVAVYQRFSESLLRLAASRIARRYRSRFDEEDVVQSAFRSFYARNENGHFEFNDWDNIWALLVAITVRKCCRKVEEQNAKKRDVRRDSAKPLESHSNDELGNRGFARDPTPEEAAVLEETLRSMLNQLAASHRN